MADEGGSGGGAAHGEELGRLKSDNHKYRIERKRLRTENDTLKQENEDLKKRVLSPDDFKRWEALSKLTLKPEEITAALTERDELKAKVARSDLREERGKAAEALGWKAGVLDRLMELERLTLDWREVERPKKDDPKGTEKVRMPHVRPAADEKAELKPLDKYVSEHLADFLPALSASATEGGGDKRADGEGVRFPKQPVSGKPAGDGPSREEITQRKRASGVYGF